MTTIYQDISVTGSFINDTVIGEYFPSSGYFNTLELNGTGVSISGHQHLLTDISDLGSGITGISALGDIPSGVYIYTTGENLFGSGVITDLGRSILDDETVADVKATLGIESLSTVSGVVVLGSDAAADIILSDIDGSGTIFNNLYKNIDFYVKGSGDTGNAFYYDASKGRLGINTLEPDSLVHVVSNCALDGFKIETTTNCSTGVHIFMLHNPGSAPIDGSYNGTISLAGRDHNNNVINYARLRSLAASTDNNSTSGTFGELHGFIDKNGDDSMVMRLARDVVLLGSANDLQIDSSGSYMIGSGNVASGNYFIVLGNNNSGTVNHYGIVLGNDNELHNIDNHAIGKNIVLHGSGNSAFGFDIMDSGNLNYIYASDVSYTGNNSVILGVDNQGSGSNLISVGNTNYNYGLSNILIGSGLEVRSNKSVVIGNSSLYNGNSGVLIGAHSATTGNNNFIVGNNIKVVSTGLFICGQDLDVSNVQDSLILEKNVSVTNTSGVVIVGRGNNIGSTNNIAGIYGYQNATDSDIKRTNILGGENALSNASGSLIVGSENFASGTVYNTINIGRKNYLHGTSYNNIFIGNLTNQSGLQLSTNGTITGTSYDNNNPLVNIVAVGNQNVFPSTGNMTVALGNKNKSFSNGGVIAGSLNSLNGHYSTLIGKSNYVVGNDNILMGNDNNLYGTNSVVISPRDSLVYGTDNIVIGNNEFVSNGTFIGNDNAVYGDSNLVIGDHNDIGDTRYSFVATISNSNITAYNITGTTNLSPGDEILIYVTNIVGSDVAQNFVYARTIATNGVVYDAGTNITQITVNNGAVPLTNSSVSNPSNFDDAFVVNSSITVANGYIIRFNQSARNYLYGDNNVISSGTGNLVIGNNNSVSHGLRNILFGQGLSATNLSDSMIIGPDLTKRVIIGDNIVFNSGLGQNNIFVVGTDDVAFANFNNVNKRLGIGNTNPRSTLDVSGTLTATNLRLGLTSTPNLELVTNSDGTISAATRTMFSGTTNGFVYMLSNNIGSGIDSTAYNVDNDSFTWFNTIPSDPTETTPGLVITPNQGAIFNASNSFYDEEFNLTIYGSGDPVDAPVLFDTEYLHNRIVMYNTVADTGVFKGDVRVTGLLYLPSLQTDGSVLRINSDGDIESNKLLASTIPTVTTDYKITGYQTMRYFGDEKVFCLAKTDVADHATLTNTFVDSEYNIILSSDPTQETIFNRQGESSSAGSGFVVLYENSDRDQQGFRIDYTNKQVGINTRVTDLEDHPNKALVVNGPAYVETLRVGTATTAGNILVADANGNLSYQAIDLGLAANTLRWPLSIDVDGGTSYLALSSDDEDGVALDNNGVDNDLGRMLAWNGDSSSWYSTSHLRAYKGDTDGSKTHNIMFGEHASNSYLQTKDMHIFSAGSFHSSADEYRGSSQYAQYYLRGSGNGTAVALLFTDWSIDNVNPTANRTNQIAIPAAGDTPEFFSWHYELIVSLIGKDISEGATDEVLRAGSIRVEGAFHSLNGQSNLTFLPASVTKFVQSELDPIGVELVSDLNTAGVVNIRCTGVSNYSIMWSAVARINQLSLPNF
jgi:hypothetical protein